MVYASKKYADLGISVGQLAKTFPAVFWFAVVASFVGIFMLLFCAVSKDNIFFKFLTTKLWLVDVSPSRGNQLSWWQPQTYTNFWTNQRCGRWCSPRWHFCSSRSGLTIWMLWSLVPGYTRLAATLLSLQLRMHCYNIITEAQLLWSHIGLLAVKNRRYSCNHFVNSQRKIQR